MTHSSQYPLPATPGAARPAGETIDLRLAADLQDHLLSASNDLDRLQVLLAGACDALASSFFGANAQIDGLREQAGTEAVQRVERHLGQAITALQFQDMAAQLIAHTERRLRNCADRLAVDAFGGSDGEDGPAVIAAAPARPNPVTQDEMDAGSIELF
jgi:hypothetical protein